MEAGEALNMNVLMEPRHLWVAIEFLVAPLPEGLNRFVDVYMLLNCMTSDDYARHSKVGSRTIRKEGCITITQRHRIHLGEEGTWFYSCQHQLCIHECMCTVATQHQTV